MSCGLPHIPDQTVSGRTGEVWDGNLSGKVGRKLGGLLGSGLCECCKVQLAACSWLSPSEMDLLQNFHRTVHVLPCAACAHRHLSKLKANLSLLVSPTLRHLCTLTFSSVITNSGEQDAVSRDLQAHPTWIIGLWPGTQLPSLMVEQPSFNVMPAVDGSQMGLSMGQHC